MGLFNFRNKNDIVPKEKKFTSIVNKFGNVDAIKLNARLVVPNNYIFVIGKKGKVADKFEEGEHYFSLSNLPIMCRKFRIDDLWKKGKKQFSADFYFVKNDINVGAFETYRKVDMGTKAYGFFSCKVIGEYTYRVKDVKEFMQSLLNEFDYIKTGEAEKLLSGWVDEVVVKELESQNFILQDVVNNSPKIIDILKIRISKLFSIIGLELIDFKILEYKLPKKYQQDNTNKPKEENSKDTQNINEPEKLNISQESVEEIEDVNNAIESQEESFKQQYYDIEKIDNDLNDAQTLLNDFGLGGAYAEKENKEEQIELQKVIKIQTNADIEESAQKYNNSHIQNEINEDENFNKNNQHKIQDFVSHSYDKNSKKDNFKYVPFGNFVFEKKSEEINVKNKKTFVDLSLNELYTNDVDTKRCLNCGAENKINANHCVLCGENFYKGEDI